MDNKKDEFRLLNADDIEVRIGSINEYGISLLLYKNARVDMAILDEKFGSMGWKKTYSRDNKNCLVEIWDHEKNEWIGKEDTGTESNTEKEKGLASDSFKRACVAWGIGRELYTAPDMFVRKDRLHNFKSDGNKFKCYDKFSVLSITYDEKRRINTVTIGISEYGKVYDKITYSRTAASATASQSRPAQTQSQPAPAPKPQQTAASTQPAPAPVNSPAKPAATSSAKQLFADDEKILIGGCSGYTYKQAVVHPAFKSFLNWVRNNPQRKYDDEMKNSQFKRFLELATMQQ